MNKMIIKTLIYLIKTVLINNRMLSDMHYNYNSKLTNPIDERYGKHRNEGYKLIEELKEGLK